MTARLGQGKGVRPCSWCGKPCIRPDGMCSFCAKKAPRQPMDDTQLHHAILAQPIRWRFARAQHIRALAEGA